MISPPKAAIYVRVSTLDQNTEIQRDDLSRYADNRGLSIIHIFEDKMSGTHAQRPQFQALLSAARRREFDTVIVWKLDRFGRSLKDVIIHLTELQELGITFISLRDQIDFSTSSGRLMMHLLASFAEFEASLIKERVRAGIANAKRKGIKLGRPQATDPRLILSLRSEGLSYSAIARRLGVSKSLVHKTLKTQSSIKSVTNPEIIEPVVSTIKE